MIAWKGDFPKNNALPVCFTGSALPQQMRLLFYCFAADSLATGNWEMRRPVPP